MKVTNRIAAEIASHEGLVREAYRDSKGIWTWGVGVTNASGHTVHPRYVDNPQSVERCIEVFMWLLEQKYAPAVRKAFKGKTLTESQFGAALSFHYNTGAISRATWVKKFMSGDTAGAKKSFMSWRKPPEIIPRREKERDLFFDGKWGDGKVTVYPVRKPPYTPDWRKGKRVNIDFGVKTPPPPDIPTPKPKPKEGGKMGRNAAIVVLIVVICVLAYWALSGGM